MQNVLLACKGNRQVKISADHLSRYVSSGHTVYDGDTIVGAPASTDPRVAELEKRVAELETIEKAQAETIAELEKEAASRPGKKLKDELEATKAEVEALKAEIAKRDQKVEAQ
jgi:hypothetical protein